MNDMCSFKHECNIESLNICLQISYGFPCILDYDSLGIIKNPINFPYLTLYNCKNEKCEKGEFLCNNLKFCISVELICDGINHCYTNEDEMNCEFYKYQNLYKCRNYNRGILIEKYCNEIIDCPFGDDELYCSTKNQTINHFCQTIDSKKMECKLKFYEKVINLENLDKRIKKLIIYNQNTKIYLNKSKTQLIYLSIVKNNEKFLNIFEFLPNLVTLILKSNNLKFKKKFISHLNLLQYLDLSFNSIKNFDWVSFLNITTLRFLDLSGNPIKNIKINFKHFTYLKILKILKCPILNFGKNTFIQFSNLREIHLNDTTKIEIFNVKNLKNLLSLKTVHSKSYSFCCLLWQNVKNKLNCYPKTKMYSNCSNLLGNILIKILFWLIGVIGMSLNIISGICASKVKSSIKLYKYFIIFSDFLTSTFFFIIACTDAFYDNIYMLVDEFWRKSYFCSALGTFLQFH